MASIDLQAASIASRRVMIQPGHSTVAQTLLEKSGAVPAAVLTLLLCSLPVRAEDPLLLLGTIESITAEDWQIAELSTALELSKTGIRGEVQIGKLELPSTEMSFADIGIQCERILLTTLQLRCEEALFTATFPGLGRHTVPGWFAYDRQSGDTRFEISRLPVASAGVNVTGIAGESGIELQYSGARLRIDELAGIAGELGIDLQNWTASGFTTINGTLITTTDATARLALTSSLSEASISNEPGTIVTDAMQGRIDLVVNYRDEGWNIDLDASADRGEMYIEPVYANFSEHAVSLHVTGIDTNDFLTFDVARFQLQQDTLMTMSGQATLSLPKSPEDSTVISGQIEFDDTSVQTIYDGLLQILAAGTMLGDMETDGRVSGTVSVAANAPMSADLRLQNLILDDRQGRFAIYGLGGQIHWPGPEAEPADAAPSSLHWDSATAYNIIFSGGDIAIRLGGDDIELLSPLRLATMGGALLINQLVMNNYGTDAASGLLDAELEPIQLGQLTGAFGWPAFSGRLAGRLPLLTYEGNAMTVGGSLTARAFDGDIEFTDLRLEQPFGLVPRLQGNLRLRQLDLQRLTDTFSFGLIQGRLSGDVAGLEMLGWRPVAMDLHLYTPPGDKSRRRISQRAVENLASVGGGGAAAALSSGMLKFFDVFAYDRIALRCVLRDGVCAMSGAGPAGDGQAGQGYYIVKGSGLPRIDVVGYRDQVNWARLVRQLVNITRSDAPVVN